MTYSGLPIIRLCIFGSAADRFIRWIWTNHDTLLTRKSNSHSEAIQRRCSHTLLLNVNYCRSGKTNMKVYDFFGDPPTNYKLATAKFHTLYWIQLYRQEKLLRHFATVGKLLDNIKTKASLKKWIRTVSNLDDLIQFHSICQMME